MLVYGDVNGGADHGLRTDFARGGNSQRDGNLFDRGIYDLDSHTHIPGPRPIDEAPEPLPVEEMDIPPDPDGGSPGALDELLRSGPSILDEMLAQASPRAPTQHRAPSRTYRSGSRAQPAQGPGSLTRVVGINDMAIGGNTLGDGRGNVLRENMRHFGIIGTRAR